jgi:hypothetical protein
MKPLPILCVIAALAVAQLQPAYAQKEEFDTDKMLKDLEQQLRLKKDEYDKLKPELEQALQAKSKELNQSINEAVDKGFVELEKMSKEMEAASEQARQELEKALNSEQVQELKAFLNKLDKDAIKAVYQELLDELTKLLALTQEQIEKIGPVIKQALEKQAELLRRFAQDTGKKFEQFRKEYEALSADTQRKLKDTLDSGQLEKMDKHMEDIKDKIQDKVFKEA